MQNRRLAAMQGAAGAGAAQAVASALADDGLQANERNLGKDLAAQKTMDSAKDVLLNEAVSILSDGVALKQSKARMDTSPLSGSPVVVMELPTGR